MNLQGNSGTKPIVFALFINNKWRAVPGTWTFHEGLIHKIDVAGTIFRSNESFGLTGEICVICKGEPKIEAKLPSLDTNWEYFPGSGDIVITNELISGNIVSIVQITIADGKVFQTKVILKEVKILDD